MTFYHEKEDDIAMTISSLIDQTYPKERYEVLMIVEPDDIETKSYAEENIKRLYEAGISGRIIRSDGKLKIKPHALNIGIEEARGEYCAFYDASDAIESDQIEKLIYPRQIHQHSYNTFK
jgi:cellulose synthase/poly-beta-1,6-N-acetylglucosamine synthase-like glycosyltransferase